jgi:tetratricopeptide (TPR) repeat protein/predicted Ser/Thr protein kinase
VEATRVLCPRCGKVYDPGFGFCPWCAAQGAILAVEEGPGAIPSAPPAAPPEVSIAAPSSHFGRYVRTSLLGEGGMGQVWKAWDKPLGRWVALKFVKTKDDAEIARFGREAQIAGKLSHPNIGAIYEWGESDGRPFIAMQFVAGHTLDRARVDRRTLAMLLRDAARAVEYAHERGIIHRDLKPANLMVAGRHIYVMDFGLARSVEADARTTASGSIVGTPAYMSPEQARGVRADGRADVYALGATLYDRLTGRPPFAGPTVYDILRKLADEDPVRPRAIDPSIDADLETIALKCLEKDASRRYASAAALADDLDRFLAGEPVAARPISSVARIWRRAKRNRALSIAMLAALVIAVAGLVTVGIQRQRAAAALEEQRRSASMELLRKETERLAGEARLKKLSELWMRILDRKRDLRVLEVSVEKARPALVEAVLGVDAFAADHPEMPQAWYLKGRGWMYLDDAERAEEAARKAVALDAEFAPGWRLLGMALMQQAQTQWVMMTETPHNPRREKDELVKEGAQAIARGSRDVDADEEAMRWGLPRSSDDDVMRELALALELYYGQGRLADAMRRLETLASERKAAEYAMWRGLLAGNPKDEFAWFDRAITWAPGDSFALFYRGLLKQWRRADAAGSIEDYDRAIAIRSDFAIAHLSRGHARKDLGDRRGGIEDYTRAIEIRPDFAEAYLARGIQRRKDNDNRSALEDFDRAAELRQDWLGYFHRGTTRHDLGDYDGALADYDRVISLKADIADIWANRGLIRETRGQLEQAEADLREALRVAPADWPYRAQAAEWLKRVEAKRKR